MPEEHLSTKPNDEGADTRKDSVRQARDTPCDALSSKMSLSERLLCHAQDLEEERGKGLGFIADIREAARRLSDETTSAQDRQRAVKLLRSWLDEPQTAESRAEFEAIKKELRPGLFSEDDGAAVKAK